MPDFHTITVDDNDVAVKIIRSYSSKNIKMRVNSDGIIVISAPKHAPLFLIKQAILKNKNWLITQLDQRLLSATSLIKSGIKIGNFHTLHFLNENKLKKPRIKISSTQTLIRLPDSLTWDCNQAQVVAKKAIIDTLRKEASEYLPARLEELATQYNFKYRSVHIRKLERRWGSCSSNTDITFNFRLMSHSLDIIDYVIIHELCHTIYPHHQATFWKQVSVIMPNYKDLKHQLNHNIVH